MYKSTIDMPKADWLRLRQKGIGGSDVAAVLGLNPWKSPLDVYYDKVNPEPVIIPENAKMRAGNIMENVIALWWSQDNERRIRKDNKIYIHDDIPFYMANIDRLIVAKGKDDTGILECKNTGKFVLNKLSQNEMEIPYIWYCQLQHYLFFGYAYGYIAYCVDGWDFQSGRIEFDKEYQELALTALDEFWNYNVLKKNPPEPKTSSDIQAYFQDTSPGKIVECDERTAININDLQDIREQLKPLQQEEENLKIAIQAFMDDAEILTDSKGETVITWKKSKDSKRLNRKKLESEYPEIYLECQELIQGSRKFLPKF